MILTKHQETFFSMKNQDCILTQAARTRRPRMGPSTPSYPQLLQQLPLLLLLLHDLED